jgi:hypothetical protein
MTVSRRLASEEPWLAPQLSAVVASADPPVKPTVAAG